ncbi:D-2-hydroxyacid dehydrogenase [Salinibacillus xinjiangensis]|uniref:D-2-hydroxyacid dehydrogenase n=1 Tax=Salinibacillus xinjiangensis TaxID=1229268 RepID=A0A6G1X9C8_9BACI|nr:D-2-hydroxyacid dehydrogenase [Salinibacillus xinjiangensis]MRG87552.1 D-2-hydroxyacid dehydrogenase [Salinibacillus xinjiangensis]
MNILTTCKVKSRIQEKLLQSFPDVTFQFCTDIETAEAYLGNADILITYGGDLLEEHIQKASNLKWIMVLSAGVDQLPFQAIKERSIIVTNARGIHGVPMSEYAISMVLQVSRNSKTLWENERNHTWDQKVKMNEINGKTLLIVGAGAIGEEVARLAKAFRMRTIGVSRSGRPIDYFDECIKVDALTAKLPDADVVISILPSTPETKNLFRKEQFDAMKDDGVFLNMGRGDVVNESDLTEALQKRSIAHAVLDVFQEEPLPDKHPFWDMESVTITPHISGVSQPYQHRAMEIFEQNLKKYLHNEKNLINVIDPNRGY